MSLDNSKKRIKELGTNEVNGFEDLDEYSIRDCSSFIKNPSDYKDAVQNAKNISSSFGNMVAWILNASSQNPDIRKIYLNNLLVLYLKIAEAAYMKYDVTYRIHKFDLSHPVEKKMKEDLTKLKVRSSFTGMEADTDHILELCIDDRAMGIYYPGWGCFVPGTRDYRDTIHGKSLNEFMKLYPHVVKRCRAILTNLLNCGADGSIMEEVLSYLGGPLTIEEMSLYEGEMKEPVPQDISNYIRTTSLDTDPAAVCGYMGKNSGEKLSKAPVLIYTGTMSMDSRNQTLGVYGDNLYVLPPVQSAGTIENVEYVFGGPTDCGLPSWIDFTAEIDGKLYHKVFTGDFAVCEPDNYIDMAYMVPDGLLKRFNYLVQESAAGAYGKAKEIQTTWKVYPEDSSSVEESLSSIQYKDNFWNILQRSKRIERMELCDEDTHEVLGTLVLKQPASLRKTNQHMHVAFDAAATESVLLKSVEGSGQYESVASKDMIYPLTPMAQKEFEQMIERRTSPAERNGTHFESLIQRFDMTGPGIGLDRLNTLSRIWKPDEDALFAALRTYPGTMTEAMAGLGVISNMKELLTHTDIPPKQKKEIEKALIDYVGIMILESVLTLAKDGFAPEYDNLDFLISYPKSGSGQGFSKEMLAVIKSALGYVNQYLAAKNKLILDGNVFLYSESEATAAWQMVNGIGGVAATAAFDMGGSSLDGSLNVNGSLSVFSIPYAAQRITIATLAKVYAGQAAELMRCFGGGDAHMKQNSVDVLNEAMKSDHGKLHERLAFILTLNRLFSSSCEFSVNTDIADFYQEQVQELTEAKLNAVIPAYAYHIYQALKSGQLKMHKDVTLVPAGKGSLSLNNTADGYKDRYTGRLMNEINHFISQDHEFPEGSAYTGTIKIADNMDHEKLSVAQGMIYIKEGTKVNAKLVSYVDPFQHYLDLVYGCDENKKSEFCTQLAALNCPGKQMEYEACKTELYDNAYEALISGYTFDKFVDAFNRFGHAGTGDGSLDSKIYKIVEDEFENLCDQLKEDGKQLIMSCPFIEEEMICGAMIDLAIDRLCLE